MRGNAIAYWWQKGGSDAREYEDAYSVAAEGNDDVWELTDDLQRLRVALADGATESLLSGRWAQTLVQGFTAAPRQRMRSCIQQALTGWPQVVHDYKAAREEAGKPIAWYEEPGLERGAHATLLVAEFISGPDGQTGIWTAEAIGDSCLFQISDNKIKHAFPLLAATDFGTSPALVHTGLRNRRLLEKHSTSAAGTFCSGDTFFLCTDALAAWFLAQHELGGDPWAIWREFYSVDQREAFRAWAASERSIGHLKNDDVTLLNVQFD